MTRTLYQSLLGPRFGELPEKIQAMHIGASHAEGRADIVRGESILAQLICRVAHIPKTGRDVQVVTSFEPIKNGERWTRVFNGEAFTTDILIDRSAGETRLAERFGPFLFRLEIIPHKDGVDLLPKSVSLWGVTLPKILCPEAVGLERVKDDKYHFDVSVRFPLAGEVLRYAGWIEPVDASKICMAQAQNQAIAST